ncbi:MAG: putative oxidoreductase [Verrucomicrobiaceae bacterium]|nr:putative oxidoreductase [Verrucomicrobiaceae bacterium]
MNESYHYIIVGAGSSGCVLANRLSEDPNISVLLIEAGPADTSPLIRMPRGIGKILMPGNPHVYDYQVSSGEGRANETWLKGRTIGGSSSVNGMVYVRGAPADYEGWEQLGCTGWGWKDIGRQFVALEDHQLGKSEWRGVGGPLKVTVHPSGDPLCEAIINAAEQAGTPRVPDTNAIDSVSNGGFGYQPQNTWGGQRFSAARAFLDPVRSRPNLTVLTETAVLKINFVDKRATSVLIRNSAGTQSINVSGEVILSAGAIESPKLLQLSGVGPAALLQSLRIPVIADSVNVGRNLREHRYMAMQFRVTQGSLNLSFQGLGLIKSLLSYFISKKGPMTHAAHEAGGFVKTRPELTRPDAQIGVSLFSMTGDGRTVRLEKEQGVTIGGYFMRPESQGEIRIQSPNPAQAPYINANYLDAEIDRISAVSLFRWIRKQTSQPALKPFIVKEITPGPQIETDEEIVQLFRDIGQTAYHVAGTCRMGSDAESVLDPQLRVRGVEGVRVVDTSIMPTLMSGNTNAPAMAIAMRAAEIIRQKL